MNETCPVCSSKVPDPETISLPVLGTPGSYYSCPRCGNYQIESFTRELLKSLLNDDQKTAVLSHWIRTKHESMSRNKLRTESIALIPNLVDNIIKQSPPSCAEQADKFILWLGNSEYPPGEPVFVEAATHQSIMGAVTPRGFLLVLHDLVDRGLVKPTTGTVGKQTNITLSCKGWQYYEELRRGAIDSRKAFMAMQYNEPLLDDIVNNVFRPAVKQTGFDLSILPDKPRAGLIDDRLRVEIQTSRFLVADLTHGNAGAYWEAGYAEGLRKPVIYTCEKKVFEDPESRPHFDTNHHLTILWEWDPDKRKEAGEKLKATIRATLPAEAKLTDE